MGVNIYEVWDLKQFYGIRDIGTDNVLKADGTFGDDEGVACFETEHEAAQCIIDDFYAEVQIDFEIFKFLTWVKL